MDKLSWSNNGNGSPNGTTEKSREDLLVDIVTEYTSKRQRDLWVYAGPVGAVAARELIDKLNAKQEKQVAVSLILSTFGGDAHAAYRIARALRNAYSHVKILIIGPCKSAGTLIAISANELAFGSHGELGPIDVQIRKPDEIGDFSGQQSGLETIKAFDSIKFRAYDCFLSYLLDLVIGSSERLTTKTACDVAAQLAIGVISPISAQIDPHRLGEVTRSMDIGREYAERLAEKSRNIDRAGIQRLLEKYPAHGFIIDREEACEVFNNVGTLDDLELGIYTLISENIDPLNFSDRPLVMDLGTLQKKQVGGEQERQDNDSEDDICSETEVSTPEAVGDQDTSEPSSQRDCAN